MTKMDMEAPLFDSAPSSSEEESDDSSCLQPWHVGLAACLITVFLLLGMLSLLLVPSNQFWKPRWKVTSLVIDTVDLPALDLDGLVAADTRHCPPSDPCGLAQAKGCSTCPDPNMWNDGCICKKGHMHKRSGSSSSPGRSGTIVQADTSACPILDKCGIFSAVGCSKCPDSSWINDGCTCRQPLSADQLFKGLQGFLQLLSGNSSSLVQMSLRVQVQVSNPNVLGANVDAGHFHLRYKGTPIGMASTQPQSIGANSTVSMTVSVAVDSVPADVAMQMTQELLEEENQLSMMVDGRLPARVGLLQITCGVECDLRVDTKKLPATVFTKEDCKYSYGM